MSEILKVIERIRDSFDGSIEVYTQGSCVKFAMILKEIFPQGNILYNSDHAIFILEGRIYFKIVFGSFGVPDNISIIKCGPPQTQTPPLEVLFKTQFKHQPQMVHPSVA